MHLQNRWPYNNKLMFGAERLVPENKKISDNEIQEKRKEITPQPPTIHTEVEHDPSFLEWARENPKVVRAAAAIFGAIIKTEWQVLKDFPIGTPDFLKDDKEKKEDRELGEHGFFGTIATRARRYYQDLGKAEKTVDAIRRGEWDGVFSEESPAGE